MREEIVIGIRVILPYRLLYNNFAWEKYRRIIMSTKSTRSILIVCLLFSLLLSIFGCVTSSSNPNRLPVKSIDITIDVNHLEEFRAQLRKFADKHSLKFTEAFYNKDHTFFSVVMEADDYHIVVDNYKDSPGELGLSIFNEAS